MTNSIVGRAQPGLTPPDAEAAAHVMLRVISFAETVRLIPRSDEAGLDLAQFENAADELAKLGLIHNLRRLESLPDRSPQQLHETAAAILAVIADSPLPDVEWTPIGDVLGDALLGDLLGVSTSSLARYRSGERTTPDTVANRLHTITLIVADLSGSYNDFGIRRWFARPRQALAGRAPAAILTGDWTPDDPDVGPVRALASALLGASIG